MTKKRIDLKHRKLDLTLKRLTLEEQNMVVMKQEIDIQAQMNENMRKKSPSEKGKSS